MVIATKIAINYCYIMRFFLMLYAMLFVAMPVKADVYTWKDPKFNITLTFPDNWLRQAQHTSDMRLHIRAPQGQDHASCRVLASDDNRFLYVPPRASIQVSQFVQDQKALKGVLANRLRYDGVRLIGYQSVGSLGKGPASVAVGQFYKKWNGQQLEMQSIVFGGYVHGLETIFQCEALAQAWGRWQPLFMEMASTFDFPARTAIFKHGKYRNFMADGFVYFPVGNTQGMARY